MPFCKNVKVSAGLTHSKNFVAIIVPFQRIFCNCLFSFSLLWKRNISILCWKAFSTCELVKENKLSLLRVLVFRSVKFYVCVECVILWQNLKDRNALLLLL